MAYRNRMEFLEAAAFARYVSGYLTDDEYRELQNRLAGGTEHGDVVEPRARQAAKLAKKRKSRR
jgi:hypothetical protein